MEQPGTLIANATTVDDSTDLRLLLYRPNDEQSVDNDDTSFPRSRGEPRSLYYLAEPGTYLLQLFNADAGGGGYDLYTLNVRLNTDDPNEINNDRNAAPTVEVRQAINGTISSHEDEDWFKVVLPVGTTRVTVTGVDANVDMEAFLYAETGDQALRATEGFGSGNTSGAGEPIDISYSIEQAGTYFVQLRERNQSNTRQDNTLNQTVYTLQIE